jgi:Tfp pilus assembly protein PilV
VRAEPALRRATPRDAWWRPPAEASGLTLAEVLCSTVVVGLLLVTLMQALSYTQALAADGRLRATAVQLLDREAEALQRTDVGNVADTSWTITVSSTPYTIQLTATLPAPPDTRLKDVELSVSWSALSGNSSSSSRRFMLLDLAR